MMAWARVKMAATWVAVTVVAVGTGVPVSRANAQDGDAAKAAEGLLFRLEAGPTGSKAEVRPPMVEETGLKVVEISKPGVLKRSNAKYVLTKDVTAPGTAFSFPRGVTNCILDLAGHTVTYNTEPKPAGPGHQYNVHGVMIFGTKNIAVRNGIIIQGKGRSPACHAIKLSAGFVEIYDTIMKVYGESCSNIYVIWAGTNGRIHDNYMENYSLAVARGSGSPTGITISQTSQNWDVYNNTIMGGHQSVAIWASALKGAGGDAVEHGRYMSRCKIHHNFLNPKRIHGSKAPEGVLTFGSARNEIYENEISTNDARGINVQGCTTEVHHNFVACRYSSVATKGNYVENRCYGYWERNGYANGHGANKVHDNVFVVNNETMGDSSSNSIGIFATTTGDKIRLKSGDFFNNRIIVYHKNPANKAIGVSIRRSDKDVKVYNNEILARSTALHVYLLSEGVLLKDNVCIKPSQGRAGWKLYAGDDIGKSRKEDNVEVAETVSAKAPAVPNGLRAIKRLEAVELRWTRSKERDVLGYNVYRDGKKINKFTNGARFYVDLSAKSGAKYAYAIASVSLSGKESAKSDVLAVTLDEVEFGGAEKNAARQ